MQHYEENDITGDEITKVGHKRDPIGEMSRWIATAYDNARRYEAREIDYADLLKHLAEAERYCNHLYMQFASTVPGFPADWRLSIDDLRACARAWYEAGSAFREFLATESDPEHSSI